MKSIQCHKCEDCDRKKLICCNECGKIFCQRHISNHYKESHNLPIEDTTPKQSPTNVGENPRGNINSNAMKDYCKSSGFSIKHERAIEDLSMMYVKLGRAYEDLKEDMRIFRIQLNNKSRK